MKTATSIMTFDAWLKTKHGRDCMRWPVTDRSYLKNRLWWAFDAGKQSRDNDRHIQAAFERLSENINAKNREIRRLKKQLGIIKERKNIS